MAAPIPHWEPLDEESLADQLGTYDRYREEAPVAQSPRGVTVFRHADVVAVADDPITYSSGASAHRQVPNTLDPPEHAAYRAIIDPFFDVDRMDALRPGIRRIAAGIIAGLGGTVEVIHGIGYPFAVQAQALWLGWGGSEQRLLSWMADNHAATRAADRTRTAAVAAAFDGIVADQVQQRHALGEGAPDDPTTELMHLLIEGNPLTDAEIVSILRNWTAGDLGSIAACIGVVVHYLATHPELQDQLRAAPDQLPGAIDEILRIDDPFLVNRRVVTCPAEIAGYSVPEGTRVYLNWASANRDPRVFGDPDAYRTRENADQNLVYGTGIHICPGRPLATMELVQVIAELLATTRSITLDEHVPAERETYPVGGWSQVGVRLARG